MYIYIYYVYMYYYYELPVLFILQDEMFPSHRPGWTSSWDGTASAGEGVERRDLAGGMAKGEVNVAWWKWRPAAPSRFCPVIIHCNLLISVVYIYIWIFTIIYIYIHMWIHYIYIYIRAWYTSFLPWNHPSPFFKHIRHGDLQDFGDGLDLDAFREMVNDGGAGSHRRSIEKLFSEWEYLGFSHPQL